MAKEFDIYLNNRLTRCDVIVYSIPYRDGLTAMNKLILESCIEEYTLMKFIAMQTESELVAHIDKMIKTCCERLSLYAGINVSADFSALYAIRPETVSVELLTDKVKMLATSFTNVDSAMQIVAAPLLAYIGKSVGRGDSVLEIGMQADETKYSVEQFSPKIWLDMGVEEVNTQSFLAIENNIPIVSEVINLCYRISSAVDTAIGITTAVLDTEFHFSLGNGESMLALDVEVGGGDTSTKFLVIESAVSIIAEATESIIQFMSPKESPTVLDMDIESIIKRHRSLGEMGADALASYDDMALEEIDFVIL